MCSTSDLKFCFLNCANCRLQRGNITKESNRFCHLTAILIQYPSIYFYLGDLLGIPLFTLTYRVVNKSPAIIYILSLPLYLYYISSSLVFTPQPLHFLPQLNEFFPKNSRVYKASRSSLSSLPFQQKHGISQVMENSTRSDNCCISCEHSGCDFNRVLYCVLWHESHGPH